MSLDWDAKQRASRSEGRGRASNFRAVPPVSGEVR